MPYRLSPPCPSPGCPNRTGQCAQHKPKPRKDRGYDAEHSRLRAEYQAQMDQGERFTCWRCGDPINPARWDLGHRTFDTHAGPECIPCNRGTARRR